MATKNKAWGENFEIGSGGKRWLPGGQGRTGSTSSWVSSLPNPGSSGSGKALRQNLKNSVKKGAGSSPK